MIFAKTVSAKIKLFQKRWIKMMVEMYGIWTNFFVISMFHKSNLQSKSSKSKSKSLRLRKKKKVVNR